MNVVMEEKATLDGDLVHVEVDLYTCSLDGLKIADLANWAAAVASCVPASGINDNAGVHFDEDDGYCRLYVTYTRPATEADKERERELKARYAEESEERERLLYEHLKAKFDPGGA